MLSEQQIRALRVKAVRYMVCDGRGLYLEVLPSGHRSWIYRYRLNGRPEKVQIGPYPELSLKNARQERDKRATLVARGESPSDQKKKTKKGVDQKDTFKDFSAKWITEVRERGIDADEYERYLRVDIHPFIGELAIKDIDAQVIQDVIFKKKESSPSSALKIRGIAMQIFDYAMVCKLVKVNPARATPARYVHVPQDRDRALSAEEIRIYLKTLYASKMRRQFVYALHFILLTMARKGELLKARWDDIDRKEKIWTVPAKNMKKRKKHVVYLSDQACALLDKLKEVSFGSSLVMPGAVSLEMPISKGAMNYALKTVHFDIEPFTIHDSRRTASTILNERKFNGDVIEKSLSHKIKGARGVYNHAEYADQRREMLQAWADYIDEIMQSSPEAMAAPQ